MMKLLNVAVLLFTSQRLAAQEPSVDQIVERHIAARGSPAAFATLKSVIYRNGTYREGTYSGSGRAFMAMAKPYYKIVGDPADSSSDFREGYDGSAWEWYRTPGFVVRTVGPANAAIRHNLDPEGAIFDYRAKGTTIERTEDATIAGRPAFGLLVTLRDGAQSVNYIDKQSYLVVAVRKSMPIHAFGESVRTEERLTDYRPVQGILFPFRVVETEIATGRELSSMTWGAIETNRELPREWFSPPIFVRTPLQETLEHLFVERADTSALRWTYFAFRRANPNVDTREGMESIGYQMVKMGDFTGAILLLSMNAQDYPMSSSSAFGLGRAFKSAGDFVKARSNFERALKLDPTNKRATEALRLLNAEHPGK